MAGLDTTGFDIKRFEDIQADLIASLEAELGPIDTSADSVGGVLVGTISKSLADLWELSESVYNAFYPASASGVSLDNVCDLSGIQRLAATKSTGDVQVKGDVGTVLAVGRVVSTAETGNRFTNDSALTI